MSICHLRCNDCDHEFSVPADGGDPTKHPCPKCAGTEIYERFGMVNAKCLDAMKECSACPFESNCGAY